MYILLNICINTLTIIFFLFLAGIYLSKKNMNNIETKYYNYLLWINFIELVIHMSYLLVAQFIPQEIGLFSIIFKTHLTLVLYYIFFFTVYIICIANSAKPGFNESLTTNKKKNRLIMFTCLTLMFLSQFVPKLNVLFVDGGVLSTGVCVYAWYVILIACIITCIVSITKNKKTIDKKKIVPFYILAVLGIIAILLSVFLPSLCIIIVLLTLVSYLMYHTIENPDMKMITKLELAKDQAEKSSKVKSEFLSSMSHEIRTPLNAIVGLSQMIENNDNLDEIHSDSKDIIKASQNLLEIINGILDMNKIESNTMEFVNDNYQPQEMINDIIKMINIRIGEKQLELKTAISPDLPYELYGDKEKVKQIITNLLTNAVKYTDKGFVYFNVDSKIIHDKCELTIVVKDTGRGIKEEQKEILFKKFYRSEEDKDTDIEGTGLGLAITKSLVELFDGNITVDSIYGQGSTFTVVIEQKIANLKNEEEPKIEEPNVEEIL